MDRKQVHLVHVYPTLFLLVSKTRESVDLFLHLQIWCVNQTSYYGLTGILQLPHLIICLGFICKCIKYVCACIGLLPKDGIKK